MITKSNTPIYILLVAVFSLFFSFSYADHGHDGDAHQTEEHDAHGEEVHVSLDEGAHGAHSDDAHDAHGDDDHGHAEKFDPVSMIMHHIADANEFHVVGNISVPLPIIIKEKEGGIKFMMSSAFEHGHKAVNGYVLDHGVVKRVTGNFPQEGTHAVEVHHGDVVYNGQHFGTEAKAGFLNSTSSFYDFSITKNVFTIFLVMILLLLAFTAMARFYKKGNMVPKGITAFLEPLVLFVRDEIAIPNIGKDKYQKFLPYLLTVFFFIWLSNLLGLIPFFPGSANVTGNIAVTAVLGIVTFIITTISGNKNYWGHIFNPPVPGALKPLMIPIELIGIFTKPFALIIRLFANITAGHILILSLVSLGFIFKSYAVGAGGVLFVVFMSCLELLVAFLQAYIFTLLSALFIGLAVEDAHH